jgi:hypothetical protein
MKREMVKRKSRVTPHSKGHLSGGGWFYRTRPSGGTSGATPWREQAAHPIGLEVGEPWKEDVILPY